METSPLRATYPDRKAMVWFQLRASFFIIKRLILDAFHPMARLKAGSIADFPFVLGESVSLLRTDPNPLEVPLTLGKLENLRRACKTIHLRTVEDGQIFSFWHQVGPPWQLRGFTLGREVREGCIVPAIGGGLCQLSGSLLEAAHHAGIEVVERHSHTALPADIVHNPERDATVFWNYVDLRLKVGVAVLLEAFLTEKELRIRIRSRAPGKQGGGFSVLALGGDGPEIRQSLTASCHSCGKTGCALHHRPEALETLGRTALLVNDFRPEFADLIERVVKAQERSIVLAPYRSPEYELDRQENRAEFRSFPLYRLERSWILRQTVRQHKALATGHLRLAERLATRYAKALNFEVDSLFIAQSLLPFLWRDGVLGGRTFSVLMERMPVKQLQEKLDQAAMRYPESRTLRDFRAPLWFAEAEQHALAAASSLLTPNTQIAGLFAKSVRLDWRQPALCARRVDGLKRDLVIFPGPTLARKGAYAVREAMTESHLKLGVVGGDLEGAGFWGGLHVERFDWGKIPWERVLCVVQPALVENWPRRLLEANARGCPLVITPDCGIKEDSQNGIFHVPFGDADAVRCAVNMNVKNAFHG